MSASMQLALRQIPPAQRAYNGARTLVLGWYVARHDEDRYDEVTEYRVGVFDAKTEEEITFLVTTVRERADSGAKSGEHLASAAFDRKDEGTLVLRFDGGRKERHRLDEDFEVLERNPEDDGIEVSDAEKMIREMMREEAEQLKKKLGMAAKPKKVKKAKKAKAARPAGRGRKAKR